MSVSMLIVVRPIILPKEIIDDAAPMLVSC